MEGIASKMDGGVAPILNVGGLRYRINDRWRDCINNKVRDCVNTERMD